MWRVLVSVVLVLSAGTVSGGEVDIPPSPLLAIDQNRGTVIERIVSEWGVALEQSSAGTSRMQLRTMLEGLRADHLLAASLVGSVSGLRDVLGTSLAAGRSDSMLGASLAANQPAKAGSTVAKALGDANQDLVYTPVTPCRLFDTRVSQGGLGTPNLNVRRTYGAITPVTSQGGPGGCAAAAGTAVALIQVGTIAPGGSGLLQGGSQGALSFPNALILYQVGDQYGTAVAMPLNPANGQFDLVEQFATADLYGDLLGYFKPATFGVDNSASGSYSTVGGGNVNTASGPGASVAGGYGNTGSGSWSTISGGNSNLASGAYSTVGGGTQNFATANDSTVTGGSLNMATGVNSTVSGSSNTASGVASTVVGGSGNTAAGNYSVALGRNANISAAASGSFLFSDGNGLPFFSAVANEFLVGATGGIGLYTNKDYSTFCRIPAGGGAWACSSSRHVKRDFEAIDPQAILETVATLPITTWRFMGEPAIVRHLGPMAQDFREAFGLGTDAESISQVDINGVALAAIQGLNAKLQERDAATQRLMQERDAIIGAQALEIADLRRAVELLLARTSPDGRLASVR